MPSFTNAGTDNTILRETRDILKESKKQSNYILWLTIVVTILSAIQIFFLIYRYR